MAAFDCRMLEYRVVGRTTDGHTLVEMPAATWGNWLNGLTQRQQRVCAHRIGRTRKGAIILELAAAELAALMNEVNDDDHTA